MLQVGSPLSYLTSFSSEPLTESGFSTRSLPKQKRSKSVVDIASPIAADGGFGQMESDESETEEEDVAAKSPEQHPKQDEIADNDEELGGDDFDDFEAGAMDEDFGDFDEGDEPEAVEPAAPSIQSLPALESPFVSHVALMPIALILFS